MKAIAAALLLLTGFSPDRATWQREYERRLLLCSGRMMSKKNTFTDFIAAAEHLIVEKYTSKDRLAIEGGSAGGRATVPTTTSRRKSTRRSWSRRLSRTARSCTGSRPSTSPACARRRRTRTRFSFKVNMAGGHSGSSGRYDKLRETAFDYAFLLTQLGVSPR